MFKLQLDIFSPMDDEENPEFSFDTVEELIKFMKVCLRNGHTVLIAEIDE